jgi:hypothetical protein
MSWPEPRHHATICVILHNTPRRNLSPARDIISTLHPVKSTHLPAQAVRGTVTTSRIQASDRRLQGLLMLELSFRARISNTVSMKTRAQFLRAVCLGGLGASVGGRDRDRNGEPFLDYRKILHPNPFCYSIANRFLGFDGGTVVWRGRTGVDEGDIEVHDDCWWRQASSSFSFISLSLTHVGVFAVTSYRQTHR